MDKKEQQRDRVFLKLFFTTSFKKVTREEVDYFRKHPDMIDDKQQDNAAAWRAELRRRIDEFGLSCVSQVLLSSPAPI